MAADVVVEVDTREGQPVLVKTATTDDAAERLIQEAARLRQGRHPGVVELVDLTSEPPGRTITAWAGGRTLETVHPPLGVAAALLASLSATVADLHALGVIHGRIDASHVVVDGEGRPRLCGFGGTPAPEVAEADDVAALGQLIDQLVGAGSEPEPIPERRWGRRRWSGFAHRALQTLSDQATDPDPARRPSARNLARAIAETVPEARLAPLGPQSPFGRSSSAAAGEDGAGPDDDPGTLPPSDEADPPERPADPSTRRREDGGPVDAGVGGVEARSSGSATFLGLRVLTEVGDANDDDARVPAGGGTAPRPLHDRSVRLRRPMGRVAAVAAAVLVGLAAAALLPRLRDRLRPGPAQVAVVSAPSSTDPRPDVTAGDGPSPDADPSSGAATASEPASEAGGAPGASASPVPDGCPPAAAPSADLDGDECPEAVQVHGTTVSAGSVRFRIGRQGDRLTIGDWDCDGQVTPAVVRPSTGEVFLFPGWAGRTQDVTVRPAAVVEGVTGPAATAGAGCGPLRVRTVDGTATTVRPHPGGGP